MPSIDAVVAAADGLHARPAALFAQAVNQTGRKIMISKAGGEPVDAASMLSLMTLGAVRNDTVTLSCDDPDSEPALEQLKQVLETE